MIGDAIAVIGLLKDSLQWTELEPLQVDDKWLDLAKEKNVVRADGAYRWSDNDKVETRRLEDETLQDTAVKLRRLGAYVERGQPARLLAVAFLVALGPALAQDPTLDKINENFEPSANRDLCS